MTSVAGLTVGAGTVTTPVQATEAVAAGAQFLVSPGLTTALAEWTQAHKLAYLPGVATPSELMYAVNAGFNLVKFFPADLLGGPAGVKALAGPFPEVSFVPSGGVTLQNAATYLSLPQVPAVSGTWLIDKAAISSKDWDKVTATVKASMQELRQLTG
jgi:2-dehydro-3-deoxyphosphogluconate aldolase/(4S)-4-hydroxy-2-oxoglutarate aldolase